MYRHCQGYRRLILGFWLRVFLRSARDGRGGSLAHAACQVEGRRLLLALLLREVLVVVLLRFLEPPLRAVLGVAFR